MAVPTRAELEALIRERIATEPGFREALIAEPRATVGQLLGFEFPDFVKITVHEESLTDVHIVLPAGVDGEIPEEDLNLVAGGGCWDNFSGGGDPTPPTPPCSCGACTP